MKRIITYLYEYQNGVRRRNAGFFKLDLLGDECRIQMSLQGNDDGQDRGKVYFVAKGKEVKHSGMSAAGDSGLVGILVGETAFHRDAAAESWMVSQLSICGSPYSFDDVHGMAVQYSSGRYLASCWEEEPEEEFLRGDYAEWDSQQPERSQEEQMQEAGESAGERARVTDETIEDRMPEAEQATEEEMQILEGIMEKEAGDESQQETVVQEKQEVQEERIMRESKELHAEELTKGVTEERSYDNRMDENEMSESKMDESAQVPDSGKQQRQYTLQRVDISDIRSLPKKNWHLCSNSFLIHGFFSYHYLVRKDVEEDGVIKSYLGVPGVYARAERAMAMLFGFPEFEAERKRESNDERNQDQRIQEGTFGYWYCPLDTE